MFILPAHRLDNGIPLGLAFLISDGVEAVSDGVVSGGYGGPLQDHDPSTNAPIASASPLPLVTFMQVWGENGSAGVQGPTVAGRLTGEGTLLRKKGGRKIAIRLCKRRNLHRLVLGPL